MSEHAPDDPTLPDAAPGDEADPGTANAAEDVCPTCGGRGEQDGSPCPTCQGRGTIIEAVGGG